MIAPFGIGGAWNLNPRDLIATARGLTGISRRRPSQANLRRAVSTAYYAMFHCLAGTAADLLVGRRRSPAWHRVYRALEHGRARTACEGKRAMAGFPSEIRNFAERFVTLQQKRHEADYALGGMVYYKPDALTDIDVAEEAIVRFGRAGKEARRSFAVHVLFRQRQEGSSR